jgi:hypothetical protein
VLLFPVLLVFSYLLLITSDLCNAVIAAIPVLPCPPVKTFDNAFSRRASHPSGQ